MKSFLKLMSISIQSRLYYRTSLLLNLFTPLVLLAGQYLLWNALYGLQGGENIGGLSREYMYSYILLSFVMSNLLTWSSEAALSREIINGTVISRCVRPVSFLLQGVSELMGSMVPYMGINFLAAAAGFLLFARYLYVPSLREWGLFLVCFVLANVLRIMLIELCSLLCFFTTSHLGLTWTRQAVYNFFSGALIPVSMFPGALKEIAELTPFPYMLNVPVHVLLGGELAYPVWGVWGIQLVWIGIFMLLHRLLYGFISKNMVIAGG